jgi:hypothetical protein
MTIKTTVYTALNAVLSNSWAVELPPSPTWPAIVFEVDTTPEDFWATPAGAAYDQHTISVVILAKTQNEIETLLPQVNTALEGVAGYLLDGDRGDAAYEDDASVYAYFTNHVIRTPRY